jgi:hypothetical protein
LLFFFHFAHRYFKHLKTILPLGASNEQP